MSRTYRHNRFHGYYDGRKGRLSDRDAFHEHKSFRREGDRVVRDYDTDGEWNPSKLRRAADRRILRNEMEEDEV